MSKLILLVITLMAYFCTLKTKILMEEYSKVDWNEGFGENTLRSFPNYDWVKPRKLTLQKF